MAKKLTDAQIRALKEIAPEPMKRGFFSGWGPMKHGYGAHRIKVGEATANKLISLGLIERWDIDGAPEYSTVRITPLGRAALQEAGR